MVPAGMRPVAEEATTPRTFPMAAGVLFGLGLGGFFDGIVLHQVLQWHHMLSSWYPNDTLEALEFNTLWDGIFHSTTYVFVLAGLFILWRHAHRGHLYWSNGLLIGTLLIGFGLFNCVEGLINHQLLGTHRVNETVPEAQRIFWDIGFLVWGAVMIAIGLLLVRRARSRERSHARGGVTG